MSTMKVISPSTAVDNELLVTQSQHKSMEHVGCIHDAKICSFTRVAEAETRYARADDMECLRTVTIRCRCCDRLAKWLDDTCCFEEAASPIVAHQQW